MLKPFFPSQNLFVLILQVYNFFTSFHLLILGNSDLILFVRFGIAKSAGFFMQHGNEQEWTWTSSMYRAMQH
jgi:hypothetical protein